MAAPKRHLEFKCPECKEAPPELRDATYTFVYIQEHLAREHIDKLALYFCPTCKEGFATPFHVHDHIRKKCKITDIIQTEHYTRNLLIYGQSAIYHLQKQTEQSVIDRVGEEGRRTADEYMRRITAYVEEVSLLKRQLADCAEELSQLKSKFDDSLSEVERLKFLLAAQQQPVPVEGMDFRGLSTTPGSPPPPGVVNRKTQMRLRLSKQAVCRERSPRMHDPRVSSQAVNLGVSSQQTSASDDSVPPVQQAVISESTLSFVEQQILPPPPTLNLEPHSLDRPIKQEPSSPVAYGYSPVPDHFPAEIQRIWNLEGFEEPNFNLKTETLPALPPPRSPSPDKRFQPKIVVDEKPIGMSSPDTAGHTTQPTSERNATAPNSETTARSHWSLADVDPAQIIGHQSASRGHSPDVKKSPIPTSETELQPTNNVTGSRQESARITGVPLAKPTRESGKASAVPSTVPATVKTVVEWQKGSIKKPLHGPVKTTGQQATDIKMETISTATTAEVTKTAPKPIEPKPAAPANVSNHPSKPTEPAVVSGGKPVPKKTPTNTQKTETIKSQFSTLVLARRPELKRFEQPSTSAESSFLKSPSVLVTIDDEDDLVLKDEDSEEEGEIVEVPVPVQQKQARAERKKEEESRKKSWKSKSKGSSAGGTQPAGDSSIRKRRASVVEEASKIKPAKRHKYVRFETEFHVCAYENCCQDLTHGPCAFCYGHHQPENCATFVSFEDRRISCLLTTFCYHCLNFHAIQKRCVHVACRFCGRSNHHTAFCRSKENGQLCSRLHRIGLTKKLPETPHLQTLFNLRVAAKQIVEYDTKDNPHWIKYTEQPPYVQWTLTEQFRDTYLYLLNNNPYQKTCVDVTPGTSNR